jgi:hypothetical protein
LTTYLASQANMLMTYSRHRRKPVNPQDKRQADYGRVIECKCSLCRSFKYTFLYTILPPLESKTDKALLALSGHGSWLDRSCY